MKEDEKNRRRKGKNKKENKKAEGIFDPSKFI